MRKTLVVISFLICSVSHADTVNLNDLITQASSEETKVHREYLELIPDNSEALAFHEKMAEIRLRESIKNTEFAIQIVDGF